VSFPASCFTDAYSEQENGTGVLTQYWAPVFYQVSAYFCAFIVPLNFVQPTYILKM